MNAEGMEVNSRMAIWFGLYGLVIIDILFITISLLFSLPDDLERAMMLFDFCVCILLLAEWVINFYFSSPKLEFLKQKDNWISLIASIPFDVIFTVVIPDLEIFRFLGLLRFLRVLILIKRFDTFEKFIKKSNLDKIIAAMFLIVVIFTALLYAFGTTYGLFDDFYFVIVTLTTVGYGDVVPQTYAEKVIALILIIIGIFVFSTITAAISSVFTDRILEDDDNHIVTSIESSMEEKFEILEGRLKNVSEENEMLKNEIKELKEIIKNK